MEITGTTASLLGLSFVIFGAGLIIRGGLEKIADAIKNKKH